MYNSRNNKFKKSAQQHDDVRSKLNRVKKKENTEKNGKKGV